MVAYKRIIKMHRPESPHYKRTGEIVWSILKAGYSVDILDRNLPPILIIITDCSAEQIRQIDGVFDCI